jgi:hypothetical protein
MLTARSHNRRRRRRQRLREERLRSGPQGADGGDSRNSPPNSGPKAQGFWGQLSKGDLALIRFACRHDWNPSQPVRNAIVRAVSDQALNDPRPRMVIAGALTLLEMSNQNLRAELGQ